MKKFCLFTLSLLAMGASAGAQNSAKISLAAHDLLDTYKVNPAALPEGLLLDPVSRSAAPSVSVLVETSSQQLLDSLSAEGYQTEYISRSFSLVTMPIDQIENLAESPAVKTLSFGVQAHSTMNDARSLGYVTTCHSGLGINYNGETNVSFKGDGVLVGAFDTGFDPGHVNFYDADQTDTRIDFYAKFNGSNSTNPAVYRGEATKTAPTDNNQESHGSHVVGIAAGAYNGEGKYMTSATKDEGNVPFYGVAPQAHIAMCAGQLYNSNILAGVRRLINFAKEEGKPIVINLSIGVNVGPHDGTESDVRALNELAEEVPICIASGNEGADYIATGKEFTEAGSMKTMFKKTLNSYVDVWSSTATPFKVAISLVNKTTGEVLGRMESQPGTTVVVGGNNTAEDNAPFKTYCSGQASIRSSKSLGNGLYNVYINGSNLTPKSTSTNALVLEIIVDEPCKVKAYACADGSVSGSAFTNTVLNGFTNPTNNGSISSMACGHNTICVGAFNSRSRWYTLAGDGPYSLGGSKGSIASYSSYGDLFDGRSLPHICAPGTGIISSYNTSNVSSYYASVRDMLCASTTFNGKTQYWAISQGTSMATPYVTGVVALWLQANPHLTPAEILEVIQSTASKTGVNTSVQWGAGKIHAANGLKKVISDYPSSGIEDVTADTNSPMLVNMLDNRTVEVTIAGTEDLDAALYNMSGMQVAAAQGTGSVTIAAPAAGIYVLRANNQTRKITVR